MNDKYTDSDIRFQGKFAQKLDNFWYYYKWHTIGALFVAFVLFVCIFQSCTKTEIDVTVLYAGPHYYEDSEKATVVNELNAIMPTDFSGDGEKNTGLVAYQVMTADQLEEYEKNIKQQWKENNEKNAEDLEDDRMILDTNYFTSQNELYSSALMTGEYAILLIDESLYQKLEVSEGRLRKLSDVFATVPESAVSDYGIRFSETALYKNSEELGKLPENTILCLLSPYVLGSTSKANIYSQMTEMFVAMAAD